MFVLFFSLKFKSQLRRTRPELCEKLESAVSKAVSVSGGSIKVEHHQFIAHFDEDAVSFWLDILAMIESIKSALDEASPEMYGCIGVLGHDLADEDVLSLSRLLPGSGGADVWCDSRARRALEPYANFQPPLAAPGALFNGYARLEAIRDISGEPAGAERPFIQKTLGVLEQEKGRNLALVGPEFIGKRSCLYRYCARIQDGFPPLVIRFGSGGKGLCAFSDVWTARIRLLIQQTVDANTLAELDIEASSLFSERLRAECSPRLLARTERFFAEMLDQYIGAAETRGKEPVVILEDMHNSSEAEARLFTNVYSAITKRPRLLVYGVSVSERSLGLWQAVFSRVIKGSSDNIPPPDLAGMPRELWEIAYACELLGRCFPADLFVRLFIEAGKNPIMVHNAARILRRLGVFGPDAEGADSPLNGVYPIPRVSDFGKQAERVLNGRTDLIRAMVRERLLAWVSADKLKPCFGLLEVLFNLGGGGDDTLVLRSICADTANSSFAEIDRAITEYRFSNITGIHRAHTLLYIYRALKALQHGSEEDIRKTFEAPIPGNVGIGLYKARLLSVLAIYNLGIRDSATALEAVKESLQLNQRDADWSGRRSGLAHSYRLFSLVNLIKQQLSDAVEYFNFAMDHSEQNDDPDELAVIFYYAAITYFLYGNISKALSLTIHAEEYANAAMRPDWAARAQFLRGRFIFEAGNYGEALELFQSLGEKIAESGPEDAARLLSAWTYRAELYLALSARASGDLPTKALPPPPDTAASFDEALLGMEIAFSTGNYQRTVEIADILLANAAENRFLFLEQPDWRSGFAQCEFLQFSEKEYIVRLVSAWRALALSHQGTANAEQAVHLMQRIIRDERLPDTDPNGPFYYFAYFLILREAGVAEVDMNSAVSMAFKRLQRRASNIEASDVKTAFLSRNYWNSALSASAREHRLI